MRWRTWLLWTACVVVVGLLLVQLIPYGRDHTNPAVTGEPAWDSQQTRDFAVVACFDCHSNQTAWPWYTNIAPVSWLIQHDVDEGRERLNFSEWGSRGHGAEEAGETVNEGSMPPFIYVVLHPEANLPEADRATFVKGLLATFGGEGGGGDAGGGGDD